MADVQIRRIYLLRLAAMAAVALTCAGCAATVTHSRVLDAKADEAATGIRYFGASPYLIAHSDGKGGIVTQIVYLPDPAKLMSAKPSGKLADVDSTLEFENGVLTTATEKADATALPKAVVEAIQTLAPKLIAAALNKTDTPAEATVPAPYVFRIVVKNGEVHFLGDKGDVPIKLTLLPQEEKK